MPRATATHSAVLCWCHATQPSHVHLISSHIPPHINLHGQCKLFSPAIPGPCQKWTCPSSTVEDAKDDVSSRTTFISSHPSQGLRLLPEDAFARGRCHRPVADLASGRRIRSPRRERRRGPPLSRRGPGPSEIRNKCFRRVSEVQES